MIELCSLQVSKYLLLSEALRELETWLFNKSGKFIEVLLLPIFPRAVRIKYKTLDVFVTQEQFVISYNFYFFYAYLQGQIYRQYLAS